MSALERPTVWRRTNSQTNSHRLWEILLSRSEVPGPRRAACHLPHEGILRDKNLCPWPGVQGTSQTSFLPQLPVAQHSV